MRWKIALVTLSAATAAYLVAQTATPNPTGISMGHIHLIVPDIPAAQKAWVDVLGGVPAKAGTMDMVKLPNVFVIITGPLGGGKGATAVGLEGTEGSVVNHVGFSVKSYAQTKAKAEAAGFPVRELAANQAFVTFPNNVTVEIFEDASIAGQSEFTHYHLSVSEPLAARDWYIATFGGEPGERRKGAKGAKIPGGFVDFLGPGGVGGKGKAKAADGAPPAAPPKLAGSKGRVLDHIGFEVKNLDAFVTSLKGKGQKMDIDVRDMTKQIGLKIAFLTDPDGTSIELTEGLNAK